MKRDLSEQDPALYRFLEADDENQARWELERLIAQFVPIIHRVIRDKTGERAIRGEFVSGSGAEELSAIVRHKVTLRLDRLRTDSAAPPICSLNAYVFSITENAWKDSLPRPDAATVPLDGQDGCHTDSGPADPRVDIGRTAEKRRFLEALWNEILLLNGEQRTVLLFGIPEIALLPVLGIASMRQLAGALNLPARELAGIWNDLPLTDIEIADRLNCDRQRVINIRSAVRKRLARRMASWLTTG